MPTPIATIGFKALRSNENARRLLERAAAGLPTSLRDGNKERAGRHHADLQLLRVLCLVEPGRWGTTVDGDEVLRAIRDGWTCERCKLLHDATEEHFSAEHCNDTGTDVQLCQSCAVKADANTP